MCEENELAALAALAAAWPDWHIFLSREGRYWCARYRHRIPADVLLSGRSHPDATVIADSAGELATALAKQRTYSFAEAQDAARPA